MLYLFREINMERHSMFNCALASTNYEIRPQPTNLFHKYKLNKELECKHTWVASLLTGVKAQCSNALLATNPWGNYIKLHARA